MRKFLLILIAIAFLGLLLRLIDYDRVPPFGETMDELLYPWQGMSLLQEGVPKAWSWQDVFKDRRVMVSKWNDTYPVVSPWLEKPPLYSLLVGSLTLAFHTKDMFQIRLTFIRLIPLGLSYITIILLGILGRQILSENLGYVAALIYATVPTIILSNRLSLTENLLTPIVLLALILFLYQGKSKNWFIYQPLLLGLLSGFAILTKQMGVSLFFSLVMLFLLQKSWKKIMVLVLVALLTASIYPLMGHYYGWDTFIASQKELQSLHIWGLPKMVQRIFLLPVIGHPDPNRTILDGTMLLGYILLFSSPWWLNHLKSQAKWALLTFPILYLILISVIESGALSFYGWYLFPLFPFLVLLLAIAFLDLQQNFSLAKLTIFILILGSSAVRFVLLTFAAEMHQYWQKLFVFLLVLTVLLWLKPKPALKKTILFGLFAGYIVANIYTVLHLNQIYFSYPQPLN